MLKRRTEYYHVKSSSFSRSFTFTSKGGAGAYRCLSRSKDYFSLEIMFSLLEADSLSMDDVLRQHQKSLLLMACSASASLSRLERYLLSRSCMSSLTRSNLISSSLMQARVSRAASPSLPTLFSFFLLGKYFLSLAKVRSYFSFISSRRDLVLRWYTRISSCRADSSLFLRSSSILSFLLLPSSSPPTGSAFDLLGFITLLLLRVRKLTFACCLLCSEWELRRDWWETVLQGVGKENCSATIVPYDFFCNKEELSSGFCFFLEDFLDTVLGLMVGLDWEAAFLSERSIFIPLFKTLKKISSLLLGVKMVELLLRHVLTWQDLPWLPTETGSQYMG